MDADFILSDKTMYDERSYRETEEAEEDMDEGTDDYIPPWEMEW